MIRVRRNERQPRKAGSGRQTTPRDFTIDLLGVLAQSRGPLLEASAALRQQQPPPAAAGAAGCSSAAEDPQAAPSAFDPQLAPTPFRRSNKVMRTPAPVSEKAAGGASPVPPDSGCEEPAPLPMMALGDDECGPPSGPSQGPPPFTEAAEGAAAEEESASAAGDAGEAPPPVEVGEAEEAAALRRSMGTSPLSAAEEEERQRRSMGTSPIAPGLLEAAAGGASCGADEAAPMETDGCSDAGSPAAFDDNESLDGSDGGGDETQEARGTLAAPHTSRPAAVSARPIGLSHRSAPASSLVPAAHRGATPARLQPAAPPGPHHRLTRAPTLTAARRRTDT